MNQQLMRLEEQFAAAEAAVDASNAILRKRSAERLATLLRRPARERLAALTDSSLTPFDRVQLERSLEVHLSNQRVPRSHVSVARSPWGRRFMRRHRRGLIATGITLAPLALFGMQAKLRTPPHPVPIRFNEPLDIDWTLPDGSPLHERVRTGSLGLSNERGPQVWLRRWFPQRGYGVTGSLADELFTQGAITRLPSSALRRPAEVNDVW